MMSSLGEPQLDYNEVSCQGRIHKEFKRRYHVEEELRKEELCDRGETAKANYEILLKEVKLKC